MNREAVAKGRQLGHPWSLLALPGLGLLEGCSSDYGGVYEPGVGHFWHPDGWGMLLVPRSWWASSALARAALVR